MKTYIGLDIGGTKILGALYDEKGQVLDKIKAKTYADQGLDKVLDQIYGVIDHLLEVPDSMVIGIGAGSPGIIQNDSKILFSPNIPFKDFDLGKKIQKKYNLPFVLGNDVNVAMYGEWKASDVKDANNILGIFVGTGIGGALILDKKLYTGQGGAGEIGHMVLSPGGALCGCGSHGCLEAYASKTGIQKAVQAGIRKGRDSVLEKYLEKDGAIIKSSSIKKAYLKDDPLALEVLDDAVRYLGLATANLINIFHPDLIIFGGGVMESLGQELLPKILAETRRHAMVGMMNDVVFRMSHLSDDAGIYGAYSLILDKLQS